MPELQELLLIGGVVLIGLGVLAGLIVLIVALSRRARSAEGPDSGSGGRGGSATAPELAATSPFAAFQLPEFSDSSSLSGAFVAGPRQSSPTIQASTDSSEIPPDSDSAAAVPPLAPTVRVEDAVPGGPAVSGPSVGTAEGAPVWRHFLGALPESETFLHTTGSFAVPPVVPFANPWSLDEAPAVSAPAPLPEPEPATPEPVAEPEPATPEPVAAEPEPEPEVAAEPAPSIPPGSSAPDPVEPDPVEPEPELEPEPEDERTILSPRSRVIAPWLLILDTGERIEVGGESVVVGRKPASIEHGVPGITIPDSTKTLSKVHARLDRVGDHWTLTDLGSTNGSAIIESGGRERLLARGGSDVIRGRFLLGEVGMVLVRNPEAAA